MLVNTGIEVGPFKHGPRGIIHLSRYMRDNSPCIIVCDKDTSERLIVASALVEGVKADYGYILLKSYSENEGVEDAFIKEQLVSYSGNYARTYIVDRFVDIGVFRLEGTLREAVRNLHFLTVEQYKAIKRNFEEGTEQ